MQIKVWLRREQYANSQQREKFPVDFYIRGDGRTKSEYKIKIWIHRKVLVGGNLFDSRGICLESFRGEFLRRSIDFEINRMRDSISMGVEKIFQREISSSQNEERNQKEIYDEIFRNLFIYS